MTNRWSVSEMQCMPSTPDAMLICGGAGLRLRSITGDVPKVMASIADRPFLELLLRQLRRQAFQRVILAVGYGKDVIRSHFGERAFGLHLAYSVESSPLGTGGALRNAVDLLESDSVLIMNGDSYTDADLSKFVAAYRESKADVSVLLVPADGRDDCGTVLMDESGRLARFEEKPDSFHAPYLNAGIYIISHQMLYEIPPGLEISLEKELLPRWLRQGKDITGFVCISRCIDIGTPERYRSAQEILANVEVDAEVLQCEDQL
jgi:NDP-sugar pyrophosphorylase family protein